MILGLLERGCVLLVSELLLLFGWFSHSVQASAKDRVFFRRYFGRIFRRKTAFSETQNLLGCAHNVENVVEPQEDTWENAKLRQEGRFLDLCLQRTQLRCVAIPQKVPWPRHTAHGTVKHVTLGISRYDMH